MEVEVWEVRSPGNEGRATRTLGGFNEVLLLCLCAICEGHRVSVLILHFVLVKPSDGSEEGEGKRARRVRLRINALGSGGSGWGTGTVRGAGVGCGTRSVEKEWIRWRVWVLRLGSGS